MCIICHKAYFKYSIPRIFKPSQTSWCACAIVSHQLFATAENRMKNKNKNKPKKIKNVVVVVVVENEEDEEEEEEVMVVVGMPEIEREDGRNRMSFLLWA